MPIRMIWVKSEAWGAAGCFCALVADEVKYCFANKKGILSYRMPFACEYQPTGRMAVTSKNIAPGRPEVFRVSVRAASSSALNQMRAPAIG